MLDVPSYDVIVIASYVQAITARLPRMPYAGESLIADLLDNGPGGKGSNLAVAVARQGKRVGMVVKLGRDLFAHEALKLYQHEHIDCTYALQTDDEQTGVALVYLETSGQNRIGVYPGANMTLSAAEVQAIAPALSSAKVLATQLEIPDAAVEAAVKMGQRHGLIVMLTPAPVRPLSAEILRHVDILVPNEGESRLLIGLAPDDRSLSHAEVGQRLLALGPRIVIITLGEQGCLIVQRDGEPIHVPAYAVQAIDTVGAGDAFCGGLAVALADNKPLLDAVRWASATAAISVTHLGAIPGLPHREAVERFMTDSAQEK